MREASRSGLESGARPVRVRRAKPSDCEELVRFSLAMAKETEGRELDGSRVRAGTAAALAGEERGFYSVAERAGRPLGALMVTREWSDWRNGWFWWVQSVYVVPQARKQGVYRALYEDVLAQARARGDVCGVRLYVDRDNAAAQAVYARLGMRRAHYDMFEVDFVLESRS